LRGMPELARRIESLDAVILQRAAEEKTVIVFPLHAGILAEPIFLRFGELSSQPRPMGTILRTELEAQTPANTITTSSTHRAKVQADEADATDTQAALASADLRARYGQRTAPIELPEHLSMVARWFYSKPRQGEIFFRDGEWPYRRILRACARLLAPPSASPAPPSPTPPPGT